MKRGKKVFIGLFLVSLVLISLGFVNAGFWDFFGGGDGGDGELADIANIDLTVSGGANAPEIVYITDMGGKENLGAVAGATRDLISEGFSGKDFLIYAWSDGGIDAFPSGVLVVDDVNLTLENTALVLRSNNCDRMANANAPVGSVAHPGELAAVFNCTVDFPYYSAFGTSLNPNWTVNASVKDIWGQVDSDASVNSIAQPGRFTYLNILRAFALVPSTPSLSFGIVKYGTGLNREPSVNYPIEVNNTGNADVDITSVKGYKVNGTITVDEYIPPAWFSVDPVVACGAGTNLVDSSFVDSGLPNINHGPSAFSDLRICLNQIQASHSGGSVSQQGYSTSGADRFPWVIDVSYVQ